MAKVWLRLATKTTWLRLGKVNILDLTPTFGGTKAAEKAGTGL